MSVFCYAVEPQSAGILRISKCLASGMYNFPKWTAACPQENCTNCFILYYARKKCGLHIWDFMPSCWNFLFTILSKLYVGFQCCGINLTTQLHPLL